MLALPMARLAVGVRTTHVGSMHGRARPRLAGPVRSSGTVVPGLCEIADRYDAVLLDQFGVLHDGKRSLAGAEDCFKRLAAAGKKLIVLSNTSRRRDFAMKRLPGLGFDPQALLGFVCSGEEAHAAMRESWRGRRVLWISWDDDFQAWQSDYLDGLELTLASAAEADFVLCHGSMVLRDGSAEPAQTGLLQMGPDGEPHSPPEPVPSDALLGALRESAARGLPMLCANPDFQVTLPNGERGHMPGLIARLYEEQGGAVTYYGKPHGSVFKLPLIAAAHAATPPLQRPTRLLKAARRTREEGASLTAWHGPAFAACLELLGPEVDPSRVLMVGDSIEHDVAGANAAGIHSLFVAGGIHAPEVGLDGDGNGGLSAGALERTFETYGASPTYTASAFTW